VTLCARVFTAEAMAECAATGHRWATVRPWGDVSWRECRRCGQTGQALQVGDGGERPAPYLPLCGSPTRWSRGNAERDEAIVRMAGEGCTHAQIAAVFGVHRTLIRHVLERVTGVSRKRPDHTQRDADIARRVAAGSSCAAVARETGMTPSYVSKIVRAVAARQKETA